VIDVARRPEPGGGLLSIKRDAKEVVAFSPQDRDFQTFLAKCGIAGG
jgi:hypothetical protein